MIENMKRIMAAIIDHTVSLICCTIFMGIITLGRFNVTPFTIIVYFIMYIVLMIVKDMAFKNASIGKRVFKLKIKKVDGTKLKISDVIKRNITALILLPLEVLITLVNNRRIGDIWAKTIVVLEC